MTGMLPLLILSTSLVPAVVIFFLPEAATRVRAAVNLIGALAKLPLVGLILDGVAAGEQYELRYTLVPGLDFLLRIDALSLLFLSLSAFLWLLTTLYALAYLRDGANQSRFFGFFSLCVAATTGIAMSGSLITFFLFYELLTLSTWPLVAHRGDARSIASGSHYLAYTLAGSTALLLGIVWLEGQVGPVEFAAQTGIAGADPNTLRWIFLLMVGGLGVKAALFPLHSWLPAAMVAPAPVSALLHAVAVVKAGAFGIVRVVYDVFGIGLVTDLGLGVPLAAVASFTIIYGSLRALNQSDIKRRLAYSTVSQVSYIILGTGLAGPTAMIGGLVHLIHQGLMKVTLFFCAGALAETLHIYRIQEVDGCGRRMPVTMLAFSICAVGMIGLPPVAGFVSKWYLGTGAIEAGQIWVLFVLAGSSVLNALYFLPILYRTWFRPATGTWREPLTPLPAAKVWGLVSPAVATAVASLASGLLAAAQPFSPLGWATLIVTRDYGP